MNEAIVFAGEKPEVTAARRQYEEAMEYGKTPGIFPRRVYITPSVSMRTDVMELTDAYRKIGDIVQNFNNLREKGVSMFNSVTEAIGLFDGFRPSPIRPGGPLFGTALALFGQNPLRPGQELPRTLEGMGQLGAEATAPGLTSIYRGMVNRQFEPTAQEIQEQGDAAGLEQISGPSSQIARGLGPFTTVNFDRDLARLEAQRKAVESRINKDIGRIRKAAEFEFAQVRIPRDVAERQVNDLITLREALLKRIDEKQQAVTTYRDALQRAQSGRPKEPSASPTVPPALPEAPPQSSLPLGLMGAAGAVVSRRRSSSASVAQPYSSLQQSLESVPELKYNPAATSIKTGNAPRSITFGLQSNLFEPGSINLDIGGGKHEEGTSLLRENGVSNLVFDPFARSKEHNQGVLDRLMAEYPSGAPSVTVSSVLNVIKSRDAQKGVVQQAFDALAPGKPAVFSIYEGSGSGEGGFRKKGSDVTWQENRKASDYISLIASVFGAENVERMGNVIVARKSSK
jgi:hypothetical protein